MKRTLFPLFLVLFFSVPALAAQIYGSLKEGDKSVGPRVKIEITCPGNGYSAETDEYGSYSKFVEKGKCEFKVFYKENWTKPYPIYSEDDPIRYDFGLERQGDGTYALRRR